MRQNRSSFLVRRPKPVKRIISPQMLKRSQQTETGQLMSWLDTTAIALGSAVDHWRFHNGEKEEVDMCINAFYTIWEEIQNRC